MAGAGSKKTQFKPGQSGNPGGQPKGAAALRALLVQKLGPDGALVIDKLLLMFIDEKTDGRLAHEIGKTLLAYQFGTPKALVEVTGADGGPLEIADARDKLTARFAALATAVADRPDSQRTH